MQGDARIPGGVFCDYLVMDDGTDHVSDPRLARVVERLGDFGRSPLEPAAAARVSGRLSRPPSRLGAHRVAVVAAAVAGVLAGSVGFAAADSLPAPAQDAAHDALAVVGVHVPAGRDRDHDPSLCPGTPYCTPDEYLRRTGGAPAGSTCGWPAHTGEPHGASADDTSAGTHGPGHSTTPHGDQPHSYAGAHDGVDHLTTPTTSIPAPTSTAP
jgi:hypothetical protein